MAWLFLKQSGRICRGGQRENKQEGGPGLTPRANSTLEGWETVQAGSPRRLAQSWEKHRAAQGHRPG